MERILYTKRFPLKERSAEIQKGENRVMNREEFARLMQTAISFSEAYEQGIEITERKPFIWIELFLTDHFFMDEGKRQLEELLLKANRVDLAQCRDRVMVSFHYMIAE